MGGDSSAPLLELVKFDTLNNLVFKYNTTDFLGKDVNHIIKLSNKILEQLNLFNKYKNGKDHIRSYIQD